MVAIAYVVLVAGGIILWGLLSSWFPRLGLAANAALLIAIIKQILFWRGGAQPELGTAGLTDMIGFGTLTLMMITVAIGLAAATAGLVVERRRASRAGDDRIPRATIPN